MSNNRAAMLVLAVISLLLIVLLEDRSSCKDAYGDPCKFGGPVYTLYGLSNGLPAGAVKELSPNRSGKP